MGSKGNGASMSNVDNTSIDNYYAALYDHLSSARNEQRKEKINFPTNNSEELICPLIKNKCECGAHSIGTDKHSDWCKLYKKY
jgi:hypothetical protein